MPTMNRDRSNPPVRPAPRPPRVRRRARLLTTATCALFALGAGNAQAGGEFEDAFESELGRLAAQHVAAVGQLVFFGADPWPVERVHVVERVERHVHGPRCGHGRTWRKQHRQAHRHHVKHHRHHKHWRKHARAHKHWKRHPKHERHDRRHDRKHRRDRYDRYDDRHDDDSYTHHRDDRRERRDRDRDRRHKDRHA